MALSKITNGGVAASGMPSGGVIQIQRTLFTGTSEVSISADTDTVFTDLTVNITPTSTSSIIRIDAQATGEFANQGAATDCTWFFYRDTTKLSTPVAGSRNVGVMMGGNLSYGTSQAGSTPESVYYSYFDSPSSTSQITYKVGIHVSQGGYNYYLNRTKDDADGVAYERGTSFICVTEIAG
tara:strand:- start:34 stop:576 length:543 start_codon:yes stop_codon:yes gene_type:complete